ncbi:hypothetical protein PanWU01x14_048040 [Parasponia andersonii]|uniref:Uncharacterized protein n=1 Tax=Parasponia andersonii TaxID=3476 RepID=A0A2P5DN72_PARAD|nr:hypothetical protein PanWU01x14_048040 [Parasponia andersonii]
MKELIVDKKENILKEISMELERTMKSLKTLNSGSSQFDHILTYGKFPSDISGLGFKDECSGTKTIFVKELVTTPVRTIVVITTGSKKVSAPVTKLVVATIGSHSTFRSYLSFIPPTSKYSNPIATTNSFITSKGKIFISICHFCGIKGHI